MMRMKFTLAMLYHYRRLTIPLTRTIEAIWREMPPIKVFFNSVNGTDSSTGNFLIAAAFKF